MSATDSLRSIPTLGYPSQSDAVIALYDQGMEASGIAEAVGASINSVHRVLAKMRKARGIQVNRSKPRKSRQRSDVETWPATSHGWRVLNHQKSTSAARAALEALQS